MLSVDWSNDLSVVRRSIPANVAVQGNLDPAILNTTPAITPRETRRILERCAAPMATSSIWATGSSPRPRSRCVEALLDAVVTWK